ncbi:MAG: thiamine phosphate synthase [Rikenellaceae bacterium]
MDNFGLYVIATKPALSYGAVAEICVQQGVRFLQLREKELSDKQLLRAASEIRSVTRGSDTLFVMNDRADLAYLAGADCLHLGQDDIAVDDARQIVGEMPIALSTHSLAQVEAANQEKLLYIGFGPIYPTTTKANPDPTVGTQLLAEAVKLSHVPVVAIGGIFPENIESVIEAGAKNICMVRHLMGEDMEQRIIETNRLLNRI